jgi:hypothetical protein
MTTLLQYGAEMQEAEPPLFQHKYRCGPHLPTKQGPK